jgi:hypothetical protein
LESSDFSRTWRAQILSILPHILDIHCNGQLAEKLLNMPQGIPISFADSLQILIDQQLDCVQNYKLGNSPGEYNWYSENFVEFISTLGYQIELTGDEFRVPVCLRELVN